MKFSYFTTSRGTLPKINEAKCFIKKPTVCRQLLKATVFTSCETRPRRRKMSLDRDIQDQEYIPADKLHNQVHLDYKKYHFRLSRSDLIWTNSEKQHTETLQTVIVNKSSNELVFLQHRKQLESFWLWQNVAPLQQLSAGHEIVAFDAGVKVRKLPPSACTAWMRSHSFKHQKMALHVWHRPLVSNNLITLCKLFTPISPFTKMLFTNAGNDQIIFNR